MDRAEVLLKEYETLRQESLDSINNRSQIVSFGLGTLGILTAGVFASDLALKSFPLLVLVFSMGIPTISVLVLYSWLGEVERMMRAGRFMVDLEARINAEISPGNPALTWERWLRSESTQMRYPYVVVLALFLGIAIAAPFVGLAVAAVPWASHWWCVALPVCGTLLVAVHIKRRTSTFR
jgi:predicted MFS family arabinose efflux permease